MKILLIFVGKTTDAYLKEGVDIYLKRLSNYISVSVDTISISKIKVKNKAMEEECSSILSKLLPGDFLVVLDEAGTECGSRQLAALFQKWMVRGVVRVVFVIGGPYGMTTGIKKRANYLFSVSKLTFTHQMVRLILVEQIYRSMTIIKNESYHHD